jgi:anti-sigma factor RsiW
MKTFEEKFTAWLDGKLSAEEARAFENDHPSIQREKADFLRFRRLLREDFAGRVLEHPDFFNSGIMTQINSQSTRKASLRRGWFGLPRLAWVGICTLCLGVAMFITLIPHGDLSDPRSDYVADVLKTKTQDPNIKATVDNQKDMTIIKLEGLRKLPPEKNLNR